MRILLFILLFCFNFFLAAETTTPNNSHPQQSLFGEHSTFVNVKSNTNASLIAVNPVFFNRDFGSIKVPSEVEYLTGQNLENVIKAWAVSLNGQGTTSTLFAPPESGRAALHPPLEDSQFRDLLNKGVGAIVKFTENNKLRPSSKGFDGLFEISEATRDMVNAEVLKRAGVLVAEGVAITDDNEINYRRDIPIRTGNYLRAFRVQTRISNLVDLSPADRKKAIDDAITQLQKIQGTPSKMTYVEYFKYMTKEMAKTAAIYQAIGFTQDSLHHGQFTLAGEVTDLGIGSYEKPKVKGQVNTIHPWFRYERQPLLIQNILYKTHSVKAEPEPVPLPSTSKTFQTQDSLYGMIRSFSPESAKEIVKLDPARMFWSQYNLNYHDFDVDKFQKEVLSAIDQYYDWEPKEILKSLPYEKAEKIRIEYEKEILRQQLHFDRPSASWERKGLSSLQKQAAFNRVSHSFGINLPHHVPSLTEDQRRIWNLKITPDDYMKKGANHHLDISWQPQEMKENEHAMDFCAKKFGTLK